jgi:hypothetical protein
MPHRKAARRSASRFLLALSLIGASGADRVLAAEGPGAAWTVGGGAGALLPQAEFADHAGTAAAWEMFVAFRPRDDRPWGARLTFQFASHAQSDTTFSLPGIEADTRTSSGLILLLLGPELTLGQGRTRVLLGASAGYAHAATLTSIQGTNDVGNSNLSDGAVAWAAGAALSHGLTRSDRFSLELGGRWFATGDVSWVPGDGIRRQAGALALTAREDALSGWIVRGAVVARLGGQPRP